MTCLGGSVRMRRCVVPRAAWVWLYGVVALVGFGVWAGSARAVTYTEATLPVSGLHQPLGVAVDGAGDVFVADSPTGHVVELPEGGAQQTLPFSGLSNDPEVAVDGVGTCSSPTRTTVVWSSCPRAARSRRCRSAG